MITDSGTFACHLFVAKAISSVIDFCRLFFVRVYVTIIVTIGCLFVSAIFCIYSFLWWFNFSFNKLNIYRSLTSTFEPINSLLCHIMYMVDNM
jgi:hypothetical protein